MGHSPKGNIAQAEHLQDVKPKDLDMRREEQTLYVICLLPLCMLSQHQLFGILLILPLRKVGQVFMALCVVLVTAPLQGLSARATHENPTRHFIALF